MVKRFDKADEVNKVIFVKRAYQDLNKPEKTLEHVQTKYHNDAMIRAQQFSGSYEIPQKISIMIQICKPDTTKIFRHLCVL